VGKGDACNTDEFFDACEGDKLITCLDGFKRTYDCPNMGFEGCELADTYGAYCKAAPVYAE
jgi:hypothetical protein